MSHVMICNNNLAVRQLVLTNWTTLEISVSLSCVILVHILSSNIVVCHVCTIIMLHVVELK